MLRSTILTAVLLLGGQLLTTASNEVEETNAHLRHELPDGGILESTPNEASRDLQFSFTVPPLLATLVPLLMDAAMGPPYVDPLGVTCEQVNAYYSLLFGPGYNCTCEREDTAFQNITSYECSNNELVCINVPDVGDVCGLPTYSGEAVVSNVGKGYTFTNTSCFADFGVYTFITIPLGDACISYGIGVDRNGERELGNCEVTFQDNTQCTCDLCGGGTGLTFDCFLGIDFDFCYPTLFEIISDEVIDALNTTITNFNRTRGGDGDDEGGEDGEEGGEEGGDGGE